MVLKAIMKIGAGVGQFHKETKYTNKKQNNQKQISLTYQFLWLTSNISTLVYAKTELEWKGQSF